MVITMIEATLKWDFNDITPQLDKLYNTTADLESCAFYLRQMPIPRRNDPSGLRRHRRIEATNYYRSTMDCSTKFPAVIAFTTKASTSDSHQGMNNADRPTTPKRDLRSPFSSWSSSSEATKKTDDWSQPARNGAEKKIHKRTRSNKKLN